MQYATRFLFAILGSAALFAGTAQAYKDSLSGEHVMIAAALNTDYLVLGILYVAKVVIIPLVVAAAVADRYFTPTARQPRPSITFAGTAVGACWLAVAAAAAVALR